MLEIVKLECGETPETRQILDEETEINLRKNWS